MLDFCEICFREIGERLAVETDEGIAHATCVAEYNYGWEIVMVERYGRRREPEPMEA
jgi:hypothetical protein